MICVHCVFFLADFMQDLGDLCALRFFPAFMQVLGVLGV